MRKVRHFAKALICVDFWINISWEVGFIVVGIIGVAVRVLGGQYSEALQTGGNVLASGGFLGFIWWVAKDAKKHAAELRKRPKEPKEPRKDGDMTEVAGLVERPPWMG